MAEQESLMGELPPPPSALPRLPIPQPEPTKAADPPQSPPPENGEAKKVEPEEIIPQEWRPPPPVDFAEILPKAAEAPSPAAARAPIEVSGVGPGAATSRTCQVPGVKPPVPPSPAEQAHILYLDRAINYEVNVYRLCFHAVHEMVLLRLHETPPDSADFDMWGPGKRSPLEVAEPHIATEVYKQVREQMRQDDRGARREDTKALIARVLGGIVG